MTLMREQAIKMLHAVPDEKMIFLIDILKSLEPLFQDIKGVQNSIPSPEMNSTSERLKVWEDFQKYRGAITDDASEKYRTY